MSMTLIEEKENTKNGMKAKASKEEIEKIKDIIQKNMKIRRENMKTRKELEVLLEGIDPTEMREIIKEVIIAEKGGETPIGESLALIEGNMHLKEGADGTTALIEGERGAGGIILLIKGGNTLDKKDEGVARDPLV